MRLRASIITALFCACGLFAQVPPATPNLDELRAAAEKKSADWFTLHRALEINLSRLLPCDARVPTTIDEVSKASDARGVAWLAYLKAWQSTAADRAAKAKSADSAIEAALHAIEEDRSELAAEAADLRRRKAALPPDSVAAKTLDELLDANSRTAAIHADRDARMQALAPILVSAAATADSQAAAIAKEIEQWNALSARWRAFYQARVSRAQTECGITRQPARPATRKKQ